MSGEERQPDLEFLTNAERPEEARQRRDELIERYETEGKFDHLVFKRYNRLMSTGSSNVDAWADRMITDVNREVGAMLVLLQLRGEGDTPAAADYIASRTDISPEVLEKEMQEIWTGYGVRRAEEAHKPLDKGEK